MSKITVFILSCEDTDLGKVYFKDLKAVSDYIHADAEYNLHEGQLFSYQIAATAMTQEEFDNLPEYEP